MRPDDHREQRPSQGGIPDGLLLGILTFLLGMTVLVWTATGLSGLFAHGSWPSGVTFGGTPLAMRELIAEPHDLPGAWPEAPETALSGYGLFWGLFIGQLMVLVVLAVFVMGTVARWRAVRRRRRAEAAAAPSREPEPTKAPAPEPTPVVHEVPTPRSPQPKPPAQEPQQVPEAGEIAEAVETEPAIPLSVLADGKRPGEWEAAHLRKAVHYGPPDTRRSTAVQALRDAEGAALVVTSAPALWSDTKDARAKLGPVLLYDPAHLCDTPARLHWSPTAGCEDRATATSRAAALLAPVRPTARLDQALGDTAELLLRSYLHAAAVDGRTIRHVHRWSQGLQIQDAVRVLRTHPKAAPGSAGELEGALTAHPERRDMAQQLTARALAALSTVNIREACTPHRNDALTLDSFIHEQGTLYVVGESIEDPRTSPGAMPLLTALASSVVERGRRMAERSSSGRLDPPMALVLDDVAAVAPFPRLPELLSTGADTGMPTLALLRSREQARARWPHDELPV
ncbi:type IV secretory system conjugative DNA transfer family protein [Streptomyces olivaceus]|uniref:type IV secretory system conjugative DNA transfer family protein n=1 Tax=Streptomyces olivaceus TaxID=47716 RepID=UPI0004CC4BCF|nr:type IV secretory system conjugative DNA transfer family protein [Streptomyces olivaceus]MBZ6105756.1 type VI secretion protein [Streptomyces olivaceus]